MITFSSWLTVELPDCANQVWNVWESWEGRRRLAKIPGRTFKTEKEAWEGRGRSKGYQEEINFAQRLMLLAGQGRTRGKLHHVVAP